MFISGRPVQWVKAQATKGDLSQSTGFPWKEESKSLGHTAPFTMKKGSWSFSDCWWQSNLADDDRTNMVSINLPKLFNLWYLAVDSRLFYRHTVVNRGQPFFFSQCLHSFALIASEWSSPSWAWSSHILYFTKKISALILSMIFTIGSQCEEEIYSVPSE